MTAGKHLFSFFGSCAVVACITAFGCGGAGAEVRIEKAEYKEGNVAFKGIVAYDDAVKGKQPAILLGPTWTGPGEYVQGRAASLAKMGYVVLVADIYGNGLQPARGKEAGAQMDIYMNDRSLLRERMRAAHAALRANPRVDAKKIIAMGYCFGGTGVLELARGGSELAGVVVFHGILDTPVPQDAKNIKSPVLVLNGADDPYVPPEAMQAFEREMRGAKLDWQVINYSGTKHAFTDPGSGTDQTKGSVYNETSDRRSWVAMQNFLREIAGRN
jgi:dienelactone hydrolase